MKFSKNILLAFLLLAFGLTVFQYLPELMKVGIKSELTKKNLTDTEEDAEEKDADDETKDHNNFLEGSGNFRLKCIQSQLANSLFVEDSYLTTLQKKTTPPPEWA